MHWVYQFSATRRYIGASGDFPEPNKTLPAGSTYYETDTGRLYRYDGREWTLPTQNDEDESHDAALQQLILDGVNTTAELIGEIASFASLSEHLKGLNRPMTPLNHEQLTVSTTVITLAEIHPDAHRALINVNGADIRWLASGTDPSGTLGIWVKDGGFIDFTNPAQDARPTLTAMRLIRDAATNATLDIQYFD